MFPVHFSNVVSFGLLIAAFIISATTNVSAQLAGANSCGPDIHTPPSSTDLATDREKIREAIRCLINAERASHGLSRLWPASELKASGQDHADEAGRIRWWDGVYETKVNPLTGDEMIYDSHVNPETNSTIDSRIRHSGYCRSEPKTGREVTYTGTNEGCELNECSTPAAAVNWWVNVSTFGHRETVLSPGIRQIGVGISGIGADHRIPIGGDMGTYVVDFGDCATFVEPTEPPDATDPANPSVTARTIVRFEKLHINKCPEWGVCTWKLGCNLGDQNGREFITREDRDEGLDLEIRGENTLVKEGGLPIEVTCTVHERDAPFLDLDNAVWEHVGTVTHTFRQSGNGDFRIAQRPSEGDVTVHVFVEPLASTSTPLQIQPVPAAPRNCKAPSGEGHCGSVSVKCDQPLPFFDIVIRGGGSRGVSPYRTINETGLIDAEYWEEGEFDLSACARNTAGITCGNSFRAKLGPAVCINPPVDQDCPDGEIRCPGLAACIPIAHCSMPP